MRYFAAVARHLHFTRAAEELRIAQPALSQQIAQLERELGIVLLERDRKRVRLTPPGEALLRRAEQILAAVEGAAEEMRAYAGVTRGRVVLGTLAFVGATWLPALLARFHQRYPGVEIVLREEVTDQLAALLAAGQVDLALVHVTESVLPPGLAEAGVAVERLFAEDLVLVVAPSHRLAREPCIAPAVLRDEPFIAFKTGAGLRRALERIAAGAGFTPRISLESGDLGTIRGLVAAGLGVSILPRSVAAAPGPAVASVPLAASALTRTVLLAWREGRYHSPAAAACLSFIREDVATHPWDIPLSSEHHPPLSRATSTKSL